MQVHPGASNVIPGRVDLSLEIRGMDEAVLDAAEAELAEHGALSQVSRKRPVASSRQLLEVIEQACDRLKLSWRRMPSGAGHDAMSVAALGPEAMIFVPSRGGVSHSPLEFTEPGQCVNGARVMLEALLELDRNL